MVPEHCRVVDGLKLVAVTASACISIVGDKFQVGQLSSDVSHSGPCFHKVDSFSCKEVIPLVSRSAGLSCVGQYHRQSGPEKLWISAIR